MMSQKSRRAAGLPGIAPVRQLSISAVQLSTNAIYRSISSAIKSKLYTSHHCAQIHFRCMRSPVLARPSSGHPNHCRALAGPVSELGAAPTCPPAALLAAPAGAPGTAVRWPRPSRLCASGLSRTLSRSLRAPGATHSPSRDGSGRLERRWWRGSVLEGMLTVYWNLEVKVKIVCVFLPYPGVVSDQNILPAVIFTEYVG